MICSRSGRRQTMVDDGQGDIKGEGDAGEHEALAPKVVTTQG